MFMPSSATVKSATAGSEVLNSTVTPSGFSANGWPSWSTMLTPAETFWRLVSVTDCGIYASWVGVDTCQTTPDGIRTGAWARASAIRSLARRIPESSVRIPRSSSAIALSWSASARFRNTITASSACAAARAQVWPTGERRWSLAIPRRVLHRFLQPGGDALLELDQVHRGGRAGADHALERAEVPGQQLEAPAPGVEEIDRGPAAGLTKLLRGRPVLVLQLGDLAAASAKREPEVFELLALRAGEIPAGETALLLGVRETGLQRLLVPAQFVELPVVLRRVLAIGYARRREGLVDVGLGVDESAEHFVAQIGRGRERLLRGAAELDLLLELAAGGAEIPHFLAERVPPAVRRLVALDGAAGMDGVKRRRRHDSHRIRSPASRNATCTAGRTESSTTTTAATRIRVAPGSVGRAVNP